MDIIEHRAEVAGIETFWRQAGDAPILYVHGNPNNSDLWVPFLERTGGVAMDLPGFGRSAKPADFDYSIDGYGDWLDAFRRHLGWDRCRLLVHDWGAVGLTLGARPARAARRSSNAVPFLPGYRWHRFARIWRTPVARRAVPGLDDRSGALESASCRGCPDDFIDSIWDHFDHGTQRAILKLYRSAPPEVLARAGERLGEIKRARAGRLGRRRSVPADAFRPRLRRGARRPRSRVVEGAGHWPWIDRPELVERVCGFLS